MFSWKKALCCFGEKLFMKFYCNKCKTSKEETEFGQDNTKSNGRKSICRECCKVYRKNYRNRVTGVYHAIDDGIVISFDNFKTTVTRGCFERGDRL
jgi:hypothetical protein